MRSRIAPTVSGAISDGVPPPKKMLVTMRPGASDAKCASSDEIGGDEVALVDAAVAHMGVEVAIRAFGEAERPMHIDPEWLSHAS